MGYFIDSMFVPSIVSQKSLEASMISQRAQFHALFQYAQGPAHLWDSHTSALAEMEKTFQVVMSMLQ